MEDGKEGGRGERELNTPGLVTELGEGRREEKTEEDNFTGGSTVFTPQVHDGVALCKAPGRKER